MRRDVLQTYRTEGGVDLDILLSAADNFQQIFGEAMLDAFRLPGDEGGSVGLQLLNAITRLRAMSDENRTVIVHQIIQTVVLTMGRYRMIRIPARIYSQKLGELRRRAQEAGAVLPIEKRAAVLHALLSGNDMGRIFDILQQNAPDLGTIQ